MTPLREIRDAYSKVLRLHPDDVVAVDYIYSLVASLYLPLDADPVWGFLVAPPASWKTEAVRPLFDLECIYPVDNFSANSLMSGYIDPESPNVDHSLLPKLVNKTMVMKEFTTQIKADVAKSGKTMSTLRSAYDGTHREKFGTCERSMKGRFGVLACVTGEIDHFLLDAQKLGERFLKMRIRRKKQHRLAATINAIEKSLDKRVWRGDLSSAAAVALKNVRGLMPTRSKNIRDWVHTNQDFIVWLSKLSNIVTLARSLPSGNKGLADPEEGSRFAQQVQNICIARAALDRRDKLVTGDLKFAARIAYDTLPPEASRTLTVLFNKQEVSQDDLKRRTAVSFERMNTILRQYHHARLVKCTKPRFYALKEEVREWMSDTRITGEAP